MAKRPHSETRLAKFIEKRTLELRPHKQQTDIAAEAGFPNSNIVSMLKSGATKLALDRVPALARALECDPKLLFRLALEQDGHATTALAVQEIFGAIVSKNEAAWLNELREASGHSDPTLTVRTRAAFRAIFGK